MDKLAKELDPTELMRQAMPATSDELRKLLLDKKVVETHKEAQERYVGPFLAHLVLSEAPGSSS